MRKTTDQLVVNPDSNYIVIVIRAFYITVNNYVVLCHEYVIFIVNFVYLLCLNV